MELCGSLDVLYCYSHLAEAGDLVKLSRISNYERGERIPGFFRRPEDARVSQCYRAFGAVCPSAIRARVSSRAAGAGEGGGDVGLAALWVGVGVGASPTGPPTATPARKPTALRRTASAARRVQLWFALALVNRPRDGHRDLHGI